MMDLAVVFYVMHAVLFMLLLAEMEGPAIVMGVEQCVMAREAH